MSKEHWDWTQWTTFGFAVVGFALSVWNMWKAHQKDRVRLRVEYRWIDGPEKGHQVGIRVTNLSTFPVTISEIGLAPSRNQISRPEGSPLFQEKVESRRMKEFPLPCSEARLEQMKRENKTLHAWALTECGVIAMDSKDWRTIYGSSDGGGIPDSAR